MAASFVTEPSPETLARLLELQPYAQRVKGKSRSNRLEAEEYTKLLDHALTVEGVTAYTLAKRLGITTAAVTSRLIRYGYRKTGGSSLAYTPVQEGNRVR